MHGLDWERMGAAPGLASGATFPRSLRSTLPAIWKRRAVPPESGTTPCSTSGSRIRALSPAMRMSQSSARSNEPPITHPFSAAMIGQGIARLLAEREPSYRQADVLVNTDFRSVKEVALQVLHHFHRARSDPPHS